MASELNSSRVIQAQVRTTKINKNSIYLAAEIVDRWIFEIGSLSSFYIIRLHNIIRKKNELLHNVWCWKIYYDYKCKLKNICINIKTGGCSYFLIVDRKHIRLSVAFMVHFSLTPQAQFNEYDRIVHTHKTLHKFPRKQRTNPKKVLTDILNEV